jgi:hypothetical protein
MKKDEGLTIQWSKEKGRRTDNTMVKRKRTKDRQYNGQKKKDEGLTIQWSKEKGRRTDNTMVKRKRTKD